MSSPPAGEQSVLQDLEEKYGKIKLADHLRLLADNQRTLDDWAAAVAADRAFLQRLVESKAGLPAAKEGEPGAVPGEPDMQIAIDSPTTTTVNHNYPAPPAASPAAAAVAAVKSRLSGLSKAGILAAILGSGVAGYLVPKLASNPSPTPAPAVEPAAQADSTSRDYRLGIKVLPAPIPIP